MYLLLHFFANGPPFLLLFLTERFVLFLTSEILQIVTSALLPNFSLFLISEFIFQQHLLRPMQQRGINKTRRKRIKNIIIVAEIHADRSGGKRISALKFNISSGGKTAHLCLGLHAREATCPASLQRIQPQRLTSHCHLTMTQMVSFLKMF